MLITSDILKKIEPKAKKAIIDDLALYLTQALLDAKINTANRVAHFLAQAAHESDGFKTLHEYWGPTAAQKKYEGRKDLGNTVAGDGKKFMGRGIFQITGRANYTSIGAKIGEDLITDPDVAATGKISVKTAVYYWTSHGLSELADKDDIKAITKKINGGTNGLEDRTARLHKIHTFIAEIMEGQAPESPILDVPETLTPESTIVLARRGQKSESIKVLQLSLTHKGYILTIDGDFGPATEKAIKDYQKSKGLKADGLVNIDTYNAILKG